MSRYIFQQKMAFVPAALILVCTLFWACSGAPSRAQANIEEPTGVEGINDDIQSVNDFIDTFQELYSSRDHEGLSDLFMKGGAVVIDFEGTIYRYSTREWLVMTKNIFENTSNISDRLTEREINVYRNIAVVRCRYDFSSRTERSTGHDIFSLVRHNDTWLIVSLMYSGDTK